WNGYSGAQVFRNLGGTNFALVANLTAYYNGGSVTWADFDNDGKPDILLSTGNFTLLYHNNGDDTFSNIYQLPGGASSVADYDNAGTNDAFNDFGFTMPGCSTGAAAWGDYDNDGALDILYMGQVGGNTPLTRLYHNDGAMPDHPPATPAGLTVTRGRNSALFS